MSARVLAILLLVVFLALLVSMVPSAAERAQFECMKSGQTFEECR